ncbi:MAG TPA: DNA polymerase III subunit gamma/tau, partial [Candidatus Limnocylindria bacterium]|nr:DNA polymerase III subunit gamma/tau [Candidatus Limnocylindria bacterium]
MSAALPQPAAVPDDLPPTPHRALYRKFRAQRFAELIGQDPIVTTLRQAVTGDRLAHAYLFVGPRGTGKTSTARILAKAINCTNLGADGEPCDACPACIGIRDGRALDVIEIDAASHGAVEDARDLVMRALTSPSELRKRVYIIDEVHMLSTHAFNALLKLIEEPPDHVVFILATTDTHKVPPTIISRTQRHDFRRMSDATIVSKLSRIVAAEGTTADDDALALIARLADGGMRDAESLLDQVLAFAPERVTAADVREAVGLADDESIAALLDAYLAADATSALDRVAELADAGRDMAQVAAQAEADARRRLLASASDPATARRLAAILRALADAAGVGAREGRARLGLELLAIESLPAGQQRSAPAPSLAADTAHAEKPAPTPAPTPAPATREPEPASATPPAATRAVAVGPSGDAAVDELRARWAEVVDRASPVLKPLLKECR